jgi:hypothetical protein
VNSDGTFTTEDYNSGYPTNPGKYAVHYNQRVSNWTGIIHFKHIGIASRGNGDWNGDGKSDVAIYRPSDHTWHIDWNHDGTTDAIYTYGATGDTPL